MNTSIDKIYPESDKTYTELGKLLYHSGLPQVFGLYPEDDITQQQEAREAAAILLGMFKAISEGEHFDGQDLLKWQRENTSSLKCLF